MKSVIKTTRKIKWNGIGIELGYAPRWCEAIENGVVSHVELRSIEPEKAPLPVTETGYRSHFMIVAEPETMDEIETKVLQWLDEEAESEEWKRHVASSRQLSLF